MPKQTSLLNEEEMLSACRDLIAGDCEESDWLSFIGPVARHIAKNRVAAGEDPEPLHMEIFLEGAFRGERGAARKTRRPAQQKAWRSPALVKGSGGAPLTATQREFIDIFMWFLRALPEWKEGNTWRDEPYATLNGILTAYFRAKHHGPLKNPADLSKEERERYIRLMQGSATPEDPIRKRRRDCLELARKKGLARWAIECYQADRAKLGLEADPAFERARITPIEEAAERAWPHIS